MSTRLLGSAAALLLAVSTTPAAAVSLSASQLLHEYNVIALGSFTPGNSEVEGTVYVGGDFGSGNTTPVNVRGMANGSLGGALVVAGDINGPINMQSGDTLVGGSINATFNNNGGGDITLGGTINGTFNPSGETVTENADVDIDAAGIRALFESLSASLAGLSSTANLVSGNNITPVAGSTGMAVLNVDASFFSGNAPLFMDNDLTTVINVSGTSINTSGFNFNGEFEDVIFNFHEATDIIIGAAFGASILAPYADVENYSDIRGTVVADEYTSSAQVLPPTFAGELTVVPLPAAFWLFGSGLVGLLGLAGRRAA